MGPRSSALCVGLVASGLLALQGRAGGEEKIRYDPTSAKYGAVTYKANCASCHGPSGEGDGPFASKLKVVPPDLTTIARRNGGRFPFDRIYKVIDGREIVEGHGDSGMPIWGDAFLEAREGFSSERVKEKITQVVNYLASIQAEPK